MKNLIVLSVLVFATTCLADEDARSALATISQEYVDYELTNLSDDVKAMYQTVIEEIRNGCPDILSIIQSRSAECSKYGYDCIPKINSCFRLYQDKKRNLQASRDLCYKADPKGRLAFLDQQYKLDALTEYLMPQKGSLDDWGKAFFTGLRRKDLTCKTNLLWEDQQGTYEVTNTKVAPYNYWAMDCMNGRETVGTALFRDGKIQMNDVSASETMKVLCEIDLFN